MGKSYENIKLLANAGAMMNAKDIVNIIVYQQKLLEWKHSYAFGCSQ
jgi:hypothetical protein